MREKRKKRALTHTLQNFEQRCKSTYTTETHTQVQVQKRDFVSFARAKVKVKGKNMETNKNGNNKLERLPIVLNLRESRARFLDKFYFTCTEFDYKFFVVR